MDNFEVYNRLNIELEKMNRHLVEVAAKVEILDKKVSALMYGPQHHFIEHITEERKDNIKWKNESNAA